MIRPRNIGTAVCTGDKKHGAPFKALLLATCVVASIGQFASTLLWVCSETSAVFFPCLIAFVVSLGTQIFILPPTAFYLAGKATLETKCKQWLLCGVALVGLQVVLFCLQSHQIIPWLNAHTDWE